MKQSLRIERVTIEALITNPSAVIRAQAKRLSRDVDGEIEQVYTNYEDVHRRVMDVAAEMVQFVDPVTGQPCQISVAGLQMAMTIALYRWFSEEFNGQFDGSEFILSNS